ncbi:tRNA nucleotidyltransferase [Salinisphaera sp. PC39]|uniref:multifunctional CCA addition/repair protein n=1 Tax=Salinisphaera sp. PC39 TaxID=1304156 RepID=UPI00334041DA
MKTYLVGGAVRDELLGLPVRERDWVVVGATPADMEAAGYRPVGRDFPVFLHPETGEEHALARTERKSGRGYHGFVFHTGTDVTLEDDLERRDLTVNAIARDDDGRLVDPFGGRRDLEARLLRHVSDAFVEDPVRLLRVARFYARFAPLGFRVADETKALLARMVADGEVDHLVPERVWSETERSLALPGPQRFFELLREVGALARLFPELDALFGVPQPETHHPEIDSGRHTLLALAQAARMETSTAVRFAVLCHDFGKALTPRDRWPAHHGHEAAGVAPVRACCERLGVPRAHRDLALLATRWHLHVHRALELRPATVLDLLEAADAFRRPERFEDLLLACEADARGREGFEDRDYPQAAHLRRALDLARAVSAREIAESGLTGPAIAEELRKRRIAAIRQVAGDR